MIQPFTMRRAMAETSFNLEMFQAEVDRILVSKARSEGASDECSGATVCFLRDNSTCDYDALPATARPAAALLQRMLRLSQLPPKQRHELENLDLELHYLIRWYQQKQAELHCAAPSCSEASQKLRFFFQCRAAEVANRIEVRWVALEHQVKQEEQAEYERYVFRQKQERLRRLLELEPNNEEWLAELSRLNSKDQSGPVHRAYLCQTYEHAVQRKAEEIVARGDVLALLIVGLDGISG